jgi:hypothetical protein
MKRKTKNRLLISLAGGLMALVGMMSAPIMQVESKDANAETLTPTLEIVSQNVSYSDSLYILYAVGSDGFDTAEHEIQMLFWEETQAEYLFSFVIRSSRKSKKRL